MSATYQVGALSSLLSGDVAKTKTKGSSFENQFASDKVRLVGQNVFVPIATKPYVEKPKKDKSDKKRERPAKRYRDADQSAYGAGTEYEGESGPKKAKTPKKNKKSRNEDQSGADGDQRQNDDKTVFVGNLPAALTTEKIRNYFGKYGKIKAVRLRRRHYEEQETENEEKPKAKRRKVDPERQSMAAYVEFHTEKMALDALEMNGMYIEGFHVRVDHAKPKPNHKLSVFIGNVSYDAQEEDVRTHFGMCGAVTSVRLIRDKETDTSKGFGYVSFKSVDAIELALKMTTPLLGRVVRVQRSLENAKNRPAVLKQKRAYLEVKQKNLKKEAKLKKLKLKKSGAGSKKNEEVEIKPNATASQWQGEKAKKSKSRKQLLKKRPGMVTSKIGKRLLTKKKTAKQ